MTGDRNDHYAVLGVASTASPQQITDAFHRLVRLYHPDTRLDNGQPDHLREVIAAYTVLRDPARRAAYDHQRTPPRAAPVRPTPPMRPSGTTDTEPAIRVGPVRYHGRRR